VPDVVVQPPPKHRQGVDKSTVVQHPPKRRRGAEGSAPVAPRQQMSHVAVPAPTHVVSNLPPAVCTRRTTRSTTAASSAGVADVPAGVADVSATSSSSAQPSADLSRGTTFQRGGTIYSVANPQPIGEWYTADDDGVIGKFNEKLDPPPAKKKLSNAARKPPPRRNAAATPAPPPPPSGVSNSLTNTPVPPVVAPLTAPVVASFGPPGPLLSGVSNVTPVLPPVAPVVPVVAPVAAPVVAPPIDNEALSGVLSQFLQLLAGRDPNELFAALQGAPPT
jgi:hypothetical protein